MEEIFEKLIVFFVIYFCIAYLALLIGIGIIKNKLKNKTKIHFSNHSLKVGDQIKMNEEIYTVYKVSDNECRLYSIKFELLKVWLIRLWNYIIKI